MFLNREKDPDVAQLLASGYVLVERMGHSRHFGNRLLILTKDRLQIRITREKLQWFAEVGTADDAFGFWHVLRLMGRDPETLLADRDSLRELVQLLVKTAGEWEPLLGPGVAEQTGATLREMQKAWAREAFGYNGE